HVRRIHATAGVGCGVVPLPAIIHGGRRPPLGRFAFAIAEHRIHLADVLTGVPRTVVVNELDSGEQASVAQASGSRAEEACVIPAAPGDTELIVDLVEIADMNGPDGA